MNELILLPFLKIRKQFDRVEMTCPRNRLEEAETRTDLKDYTMLVAL
jgi:hypothetical protein